MNILELCLSPSFGGLEIHMRDLSRWLAGRTDAALHLAVAEGSRIDESLRGLQRPTLSFSTQAGKLPLRSALRLARFVDRHAIDVVHVHWKDDLPLAAIAKRMARRRVRLVHTRQMSMPGRKKDPYHRLIYRSLDCFIAITRFVAAQAARNLPIPEDRIVQIYYGVDIPPVRPEAVLALKQKLNLQGNMVVGVVGRVTELKGQHLLIEAVDRLRSDGLHVDALIVGEPFEHSYVERLRTMVRDRGLTDQIRFEAFHPNPQEIMSCCDIVALTTKAETFGLVLVEAMHCGVAVIGSDAEGVPEIIDDGKTGLLFEPGSAESLARSIRTLLEDVALRHRLALAGKAKAKAAFSRETQYEKFYAALQGSE